MNIIIQVFIIVLLIYHIVSDQICSELIPNPNPNTLYLLENNYDIDHRQMNIYFINMIDPKINVEIVRSFCPLKLEDMMQYSNNGLLLINLDVRDFYQYNFNDVMNSLAHGGDYITLCYTFSSADIEDHCSPKVKLASKAIENNYSNVFKAIEEFKGYQEKHKVVSCDLVRRIMRLNTLISFVLYEIDFDCKANDAFLIMKSNAKDYDEPSDIPIVFYDESYLLPETKDDFANAIAGIDIDTLKYGYLYLLKKMQWNRVVVITDDKESNRYFERQLTPYLRENSVALMSETCETSHCDLHKVIENLERNEVRIVIANVDVKYARIIESLSLRYGGDKRVWIVRGWPSEVARALTTNLGEIFIFSSHPIRPQCRGIENFCNAINALNTILETGQYCKYCDFSKSDVVQHMKEAMSVYTYDVKIVWRNIQSQPLLVLTYQYKNGQLKELHFHNPYNDLKSDTYKCVLKSGNVRNPCNDKELLILMFVILVFFVSVLGIVHFFQSPIVSYQRFP